MKTKELNIHLVESIKSSGTLILSNRTLVSTRRVEKGQEFATWINKDDEGVTELKTLYLTSDAPFKEHDLVMDENNHVAVYDPLFYRHKDKAKLTKVEAVMFMDEALRYKSTSKEITSYMSTQIIPLKFIDFYVEQFNKENYMTTVEAKCDEDGNLLINPWDELILVFEQGA